jgi:hypothetical protein
MADSHLRHSSTAFGSQNLHFLALIFNNFRHPADFKKDLYVLDLSFEQFKTTQKAGILKNISNRFGPVIYPFNTSKFLARDAFYSTKAPTWRTLNSSDVTAVRVKTHYTSCSFMIGCKLFSLTLISILLSVSTALEQLERKRGTLIITVFTVYYSRSCLDSLGLFFTD